MKFPFSCNACFAKNPLEYRENNAYEYECSFCGQKNSATLRKKCFEILLNFGSLAFLDGYYREAVAKFATALERFLEFYVGTIRLKYGIDDGAFADTLKLMSKQSERQMGSFATLYLLKTRRPPSFLDPNRLQVKFRNDVIHTGKIPIRVLGLATPPMDGGLTRQPHPGVDHGDLVRQLLHLHPHQWQGGAVEDALEP